MEKYYNGKLYNTENMKLLAKKEPYRVFIWTYDIANNFECLNENEFKNEIIKECGVKKLQSLFKIELV